MSARTGHHCVGGAWNASIVAEVVTYGGTTLTATGLGAYIAKATETGDFHQILAGTTVMALYIVGLNRLLRRRLYHLAETRYTLWPPCEPAPVHRRRHRHTPRWHRSGAGR